MMNQGDANAKVDGMFKSGQFQEVSDPGPAELDSQVKLEACEKKRKGGGWITTPFIFGCEASEGLAGFGARANLITFLTQVMHLKTLNAATLLNALSAMTTVSSLFGAYVADAYLGRFTTIALGSWINLVGLLALTIIAWDKMLHPEACTIAKSNAGACQAASTLQMGVLYLAFALMALGSGGIRPCVAPFGASQFDQTHPEEKKQLKHYFNWYFFTVTFAALLASTVVVYIQDNVGWALGFGIPAIVFLLSIVFFFGGIQLYRYSPPLGSPFTRMAQVIVAAIRKRKLVLLQDPSKLYHSGMNPTNIIVDESDELEKPSSDDDEGDESFVKRKIHDVDGAKLAISRTNLAREAQIPVAVAPSLDKKSYHEFDQEEALKAEKCADLSNVERTYGNLGVTPIVSGKVYDKKNDAEENHPEKARKSLMVGPHREEDHGSVIVLRHSHQFRFFDKAAIAVARDWSNSYGKDGHILKARVNPWRLCSVQQVEELKCMVRLGPMWATVIPMALAMSLGSTYGIQQAATMDRHLGNFVIPAASFSIFSTITVLTWLPFYDKKVIPLLRRYTGKERGITFLQKIGVGMILLILSHMVSTLVEHKRREAARHYGLVDKPHNTIPISAFWLLPQHVINGLSESFMMVGHMEFFYYMLPEHLTTTGSALFMTAIAIGTSLNTVLLHVIQKVTQRPGHPGWLDNNINKAHLDYFNALLTVWLALDFVFFLVVARWYRRQSHLNQMMLQSS